MLSQHRSLATHPLSWDSNASSGVIIAGLVNGLFFVSGVGALIMTSHYERASSAELGAISFQLLYSVYLNCRRQKNSCYITDEQAY